MRRSKTWFGDVSSVREWLQQYLLPQETIGNTSSRAVIWLTRNRRLVFSWLGIAVACRGANHPTILVFLFIISVFFFVGRLVLALSYRLARKSRQTIVNSASGGAGILRRPLRRALRGCLPRGLLGRWGHASLA